MKANRVIEKVTAADFSTEKFVETARKERVGVNPQNTLEKINIKAKSATPIITVDKNNQISFNEPVIELYGLAGKTLTVVTVGEDYYLVLTSNNDVKGLTFTDENDNPVSSKKKFTAGYFLSKLRKVKNLEWSNNFVLEEVQVDVPFVQGVEKVFVGKLNIKPSTRNKKA